MPSAGVSPLCICVSLTLLEGGRVGLHLLVLFKWGVGGFLVPCFPLGGRNDGFGQSLVGFGKLLDGVEQPSLIILDLKLPDVSSLDGLIRLKRQAEGPRS